MKKISTKESEISGTGLFAEEHISKGDKIKYIRGIIVRKLPKSIDESTSIPTWFGMGRKTWIDPGDSEFRFLNHSCEPNSAISGTKTLVALVEISVGQEITIDYSVTDADPLWSMQCFCKTISCRKNIKAVHYLPPEVIMRHMPHIPRNFQRIYIRNHVKNKP